MRDLRALIERVEKLEGPCRDVDYEIGRALIDSRWEDDFDDLGNPVQVNLHFRDQQSIGDSRPTASLDAAIALCERVLPGCGWQVHSPRKNVADFSTAGLMVGDTFASGHAKTPAIALVLATLKALAEDGAE
jgi:hypothetical protein